MFLRSRLRSFFRRDQLDRDMADEMHAHVDEQAQKNIADGMSPDEARATARRQFGTVAQIQERAREVRTVRWLDDLARDIRHGLRVIRKEKWLSLLAIFVLALGTAGATTLFTIVNGSLIDLLPFPEPDRLVELKLRDPQLLAPGAPNMNIRESDYREYGSTQQSFARLAAYNTHAGTIRIDDVRLSTAYTHVEPGFFEILGVRPLMGRLLASEDAREVVISHELWQRGFGGDPDVLNRHVYLGNLPVPVVGVMPQGFHFPRLDHFWLPLHAFRPRIPRGHERFGVSVLGRLKPEVSLESASAEFTLVAQHLASEYPETNAGRTLAEIVPLADDLIGPQYRRTLVALSVAVAFVLLISCVNVMNLQFTRASRRVQEMGIRVALGASRRRVIAQLLTESALVAVIGSLAGVAFSFWASRFLHGMFTSPARFSEAPPTWAEFDFDHNVLLLALAVSATTVVVSGLAPAILTARAGVAAALKEFSRSTASGRIEKVTRAFVVAQIALSGPLLLGSLLLARSLFNQLDHDFGAEAARELVTARLPPGAGPAHRLNFFRTVINTFRENPEFEHMALTTRLPTLSPDQRADQRYEVEGDVYPSEESRPLAITEMISDGYFQTIGVGLLQGRDITVHDIERGAPVAMVNAVFAARNFNGESPIGRRYRTVDPTNNEPGPWRTIIGLVPSFAGQWPGAPQGQDPAVVFEPLQPVTGPTTIVARGRIRPEGLVKPLNDTIRGINPDLSPGMVGSLSGHLHAFLQEQRTTTTTAVVFGAIAVLLATVGLYGVTAYSVSQRTREFGIRMALGAATNQIIRHVVRSGMVQFVIGTVIGVAAALVITGLTYQTVTEYLYHVSPFDPRVYLAVGLLLAVVTLFACWLPARRAARVDPVIALRAE